MRLRLDVLLLLVVITYLTTATEISEPNKKEISQAEEKELTKLLEDIVKATEGVDSHETERKEDEQWMKGRFGREMEQWMKGRFGREMEQWMKGRFGREMEQWMKGRFGREREQWMKGRFGREREQWMKGRFGRDENSEQWMKGRFGREKTLPLRRGRYGKEVEESNNEGSFGQEAGRWFHENFEKEAERRLHGQSGTSANSNDKTKEDTKRSKIIETEKKSVKNM